MPYNKRAFGIVIGRLRAEKQLSQEALSALAGISRSHLALLENGRKTARIDTLWRISEALDIEPHRLVKLMEDEK